MDNSIEISSKIKSVYDEMSNTRLSISEVIPESFDGAHLAYKNGFNDGIEKCLDYLKKEFGVKGRLNPIFSLKRRMSDYVSIKDNSSKPFKALKLFSGEAGYYLEDSDSIYKWGYDPSHCYIVDTGELRDEKDEYSCFKKYSVSDFEKKYISKEIKLIINISFIKRNLSSFSYTESYYKGFKHLEMTSVKAYECSFGDFLDLMILNKNNYRCLEDVVYVVENNLPGTLALKTIHSNEHFSLIRKDDFEKVMEFRSRY